MKKCGRCIACEAEHWRQPPHPAIRCLWRNCDSVFATADLLFAHIQEHEDELEYGLPVGRGRYT